MKTNKYSLLFVSLLVFSSFGYVLFNKFMIVDKFSKADGGLQSAYASLNYEIINTLYMPAVLITHLLLLIAFKLNDKKRITT